MAELRTRRSAAASCILVCLLFLLTACDGIGEADDDSAQRYQGGSYSSSSSSRSSGGPTFDDIMRFSNSGDTDALVWLFRNNGVISGDVTGDANNMDTVAFSAADIGLPTGGSVTLVISGIGEDYSESATVSDDGMVYFNVPKIAVGSEITVTITVKRADGSIVRSGSKTQVVSDGDSQFNITLTDGEPVVLPVTMKTGSEINAILKNNLGAGTGGAARNFSVSLTPPPDGVTTYTLSADSSEGECVAWLDGDAIRYYAEGVDACGVIPLGTDSSNMFSECYNLTSIDVSAFDTSNVTNMNGMFKECRSLTSLDLGDFDTSNVTDMSEMFENCFELTNLDLSGFDTSCVTDINHMFYKCKKLTSLNTSVFDTSHVTDMSWLFYGCEELNSLDVNGFNTTNVTDMSYMFGDCTKLPSLNLSNFGTSNVTNMTYMFSSCTAMTSIDASGWDTSSVANMASMFSSCFNLARIYVTSSFVTTAVTTDTNMFRSCDGLVGGAGTNYSDSSIDKTYARIDGGPSAPGYFTVR